MFSRIAQHTIRNFRVSVHAQQLHKVSPVWATLSCSPFLQHTRCFSTVDDDSIHKRTEPLTLSTLESNTSSSDDEEWDWIPPKRSDEEVEEIEGEDQFFEVYSEEGDDVVEMTEEQLNSLSSWSKDELQDPITEIPVRAGEDLSVEEIETALRRNAGKDVVVMDLSEKVEHIDTMILATARSTMHMRKLAKIIYQGAKARGQQTVNPAAPIEGYEGEDWMLLDFDTIMVHIFSDEARQYYNVEGYWGKEFDEEQQRYLEDVEEEEYDLDRLKEYLDEVEDEEGTEIDTSASETDNADSEKKN